MLKKMETFTFPPEIKELVEKAQKAMGNAFLCPTAQKPQEEKAKN